MLESLSRFNVNFVKNRTVEEKKNTLISSDYQLESTRQSHKGKPLLRSMSTRTIFSRIDPSIEEPICVQDQVKEFMRNKRMILFEDKINVTNPTARLIRIMAKDIIDRKGKVLPTISSLSEKLQPWTTKDIDNFLLKIGMTVKHETVEGLVQDETEPPSNDIELMLYEQLLSKIRTHEGFHTLLQTVVRETLKNDLRRSIPTSEEDWKK